MNTNTNNQPGANAMTHYNNPTKYDFYIHTLAAQAKRFTWKAADSGLHISDWTEELAVTDTDLGRMIWAVDGRYVNHAAGDLTPVAWIGNDGTVMVNGNMSYVKRLLRGRKVRKGTGMGFLSEHKNRKTNRKITPSGKRTESVAPWTMVMWAMDDYPKY